MNFKSFLSENNKDYASLLEGTMSDIHQLAGESKDIESFTKDFFKQFGAKIKKTADSVEWVESLYTDMTNEAYDGNMADFRYEFPMKFEEATGNSTKAIKKMAKKGKNGYEVRTSTYMSRPEMEEVGKIMNLEVVDYKKGSNVAITVYESAVTEAKFVKDFNRDVLNAKTKEEVLELYPNAEFFIGKSDHFFGELDGNLFFKAYYTKAQKEFEIKSVYSQKGSNYVHLYNESVVSESKVTLKRRYTENHPAVTAGKFAKVRNKVLEAIADGTITQEEFDNILSELSNNAKRWSKNNSKYFTISEEGISLSKFGKRVLNSITVNEATDANPEIWVPSGFDKAIAKLPNSQITRDVVLKVAKKHKVNPDEAIAYVEYGWSLDLNENENTNMKTQFIYESFSEFVNSLGESTEAVVVTEAVNNKAYVKAGKLGYNDQFLAKRSLSWTLSVDLGLKASNEFVGPWLGFDHVSMYAIGKNGGTILADALSGKYTYDELKDAAADFLGIKESVVNEAKFKVGQYIKSKNDSDRFNGDVYDRTNDVDGSEILKNSSFEIYEIGKDEVILWSDADEVEYSIDPDDLKYFVKESVDTELNEAFKSSKLRNLMNMDQASAYGKQKNLPSAFYGMSKVKLDQVGDESLVDVDPKTAYKQYANNRDFVVFYIVDNEKENPYADREGRYSLKPGILALSRAKDFLSVSYDQRASRSSKTQKYTLGKDTGSAVGGNKNYKGYGATGISSIKRAAELADRAIVFNLVAGSPSSKEDIQSRIEAKEGAIAFKSAKDFKDANRKRYQEILATKASNLPLDKMVEDAINQLTAQMQAGIKSGEKTQYGEIKVGQNSKGRDVKVTDVANHMNSILRDYERYVSYIAQAEQEKESGYSSGYYERESKNYAKSLKDGVKKIKKFDYAW